ncbi:KR domain-containing protein [Corynebacterium striatum]|nr:KR domain-containing protein [Corynebacterium striatum]KAA1262770.1 KR domain-containing protein [Corynebacterium striatum]CQD13641.1 conserved hypothetical protein [Corynebacterium striatum]
MSYTWLASHEAASSIQTDASQFDGVAHACQCALTDTDQTQQLADLLSQRAPLHGIIHCATVMSKNLMGIDDAARGDSIQDFLFDCAESEVPMEEAKRRFLEHSGEPDLIVDVADVNDVSPEVRSALGADESMK